MNKELINGLHNALSTYGDLIRSLELCLPVAEKYSKLNPEVEKERFFLIKEFIEKIEKI